MGRASQTPDLPNYSQSDPLVGYKTAYLEIKLAAGGGPVNGARFRGLAHPVPYGARGVAVCAKGHQHQPPAEGCRCGYYAAKSKEEIWFKTYPGSQLADDSNLLTVWLFGDVIEGSNGYRAEKQQVVAVEINPWCGSKGCRKTADGFTWKLEVAAYDVDGAWHRLQPRCEEHGAAVSAAEVAAWLGVEVMWGDPVQWGIATRSSVSRLRGRGMLDLFSQWPLPKVSVLITGLATMLAALGAVLFGGQEWDGGLAEGLAAAGLMALHLPLGLVLAAGLKALFNRGVGARKHVNVHNWQITMMLAALLGIGMLAVGGAQLDEAAAAMEGSVLLGNAAELLGEAEAVGRYVADQDAEGLVEAMAAAENGERGAAAGEDSEVSRGEGAEEFWIQAGEAQGGAERVGVRVYGDRIVLSTAEAEQCVHWGVDNSGQLMWRAVSERKTGTAVFNCGFDPATVTAFLSVGGSGEGESSGEGGRRGRSAQE